MSQKARFPIHTVICDIFSPVLRLFYFRKHAPGDIFETVKWVKLKSYYLDKKVLYPSFY